ncbi:MAG: hypothetical protein KKH01_06355 [Firmicutes bacterium]|nr:hypothetical protein [Bacillota bacterium]
MEIISKLRHNKNFVTSFSIFVFLVTALGVGFLIGRVLVYESPFDRLIVTSLYFTTQSNLLVFIVMSLFLLKKGDKHWFKVLALIGLIDITITGFVFHLFLASYLSNINFMQHLLHTITPLFYISFYFIILNHIFSLKDFWIGLLHPLIFLVSVYTWIHPLFGNLLSSVLTDFQGASYIYPFLDPSTYSNGFTGLLIFNLGLLMPVIILMTIGLIYLKSRIENHISL